MDDAGTDDDADVEEDVLLRVLASLREEVQGFLNAGHPERQGRWILCPFCPFRGFKRAQRLQTHVRKYHTQARCFTANSRSRAQWHLVLALFEQDQA